ncbi:MAG TPA: ABC transporter permease [Anaerolineales bacterium]
MKIIQNLLEAFESLSANKLRSMLTVLGIVIGVAAVIAMLSIGRGAQASITSQIESTGSNLIYITPGAVNSGGVRSASGSAGTLTQEDANALANLPSVVAVAPEIDNRVQVAYQGQNENTRLVGVTASYLDVRNLSLAEGDNFSEGQQVARSLVTIIGSTVANNLFGTTSGVVGQTLKINGQPYKVIGVLNSKGGTGFGNQDDQVLVPLTTAQTRLTGPRQFRGGTVINTINVQVDSPNNVNAVVSSVTDEMRLRHRTSPGADDFSVTSQQDALSAVTQVTDVLTIFLGGIAGISLAVGGIGIMNIMLTTVTERTREIGLRKAIGARRSDILLQFLVESMVLSLLGGLIGVALGWGIAHLIGRVQLGGSAITPVVGMDSVLLATLFSMAVGLFFGIYPATRAARLQPVEALRYE